MEIRLLRVEGEGELVLEVEGEVVKRARFRVLEAPRFFVHIVRGLRYTQVPDMVSRICGFCGVSYVIAASKALERCLGIKVPEGVEDLRLAIHLAERVKSHVLHTLFMALPDLTGAGNIGALANRNPGLVKAGLRVLQWSRNAMEALGGRFHNVVAVKPGGVYYAPREKVAKQLAKQLSCEVLPLAYEFTKFALSLKTIPEEKHEYNLATVRDERGGYPHLGASILFNGYSYDAVEFYDKVVSAEVLEDSTSLQYKVGGEPYVVGPIARYNTSFSKLVGEAQDLAKSFSWQPPLKNVYQQVVARVIELVDALARLRDYLEGYKRPSKLCAEKREGVHDVCAYAVEAPRGILYHFYSLDEELAVKEAKLVTPTAQSLATAQKLAESLVNKPYSPSIVEEANRLITAFDPCLSCAVHVKHIK